ncbi:DNA-invertase hin [Pelotomaculum schinkii]|uniref:DNA-invertase hin n=1 Tax=Pelotomaculum schinkii TaxID=78350 RepID=A0A4Y7R764_9FIRM|nr:recombinase family protein [Pelotomaculum schinkii]TEB04794.1 DNA-invertase hin [Pelotomaculum schinkii]
MNIAAIYLRVSTEDQARHGYSLADQLSVCREKAFAMGADEILEFADEGVSGELLDRPGLSDLRESIRNGQVNIMICYDPDRLSRNLAHQLLLTDEIERAGVRLDFVNFEWQNTPDGRLFYALRGAIAEYEKEKIRERTVRGKMQKARQGGLPVRADSYGYKFEKGTLLLNQEEAEVVKLIYKWFISEDMGVNGVATRLTEQCIPTRKGNSIWQRCVVKTILTNPMYAGTFYYNRRDCKGVAYNKHLPLEKRVKAKSKPKDEWISIPVPAIVDLATWEKAQEKIKSARRLWSGWSREEYLLSGIISCTDCGNTMHGAVKVKYNGNKERGYTCVKTTAGTSNNGCKPIKRVPAEIIEVIVWEQVCTWLNDPDALTSEIRERTTEKDLRADLERIEKLIADVEKGRDNVRNALAAGLFDLDPKTTKLLQGLKGREKQLLTRKKELEIALHRSTAAEIRVKEIRKQAASFLSKLDALSFDQKKALLRTLVQQVTISGRGDNLRVTVHAAFLPEVEAKTKKL